MTGARLGEKFVLASHNKGKLAEFEKLFKPLGRTVVLASELGLPEPDETESTFHGNARIKAEAARDATGLPAISDDSGISVDALDGAPGVFSARWAPDKDFSVAAARIAHELQEKGVAPNGARAKFVCVIAVALHDDACEFFRGEVEGKLTFPPRGTNGFGYDAWFVPDGETRTFGEMTGEEKQTMSHRVRAVHKLQQWLGDEKAEQTPSVA